MAAQGLRRREYEDRESGSRTPVLVLSAIAIFGLAVLMMYIAIAEPQQGTAMGAIRDVMRGLGGHLCVALPLVVAWAGVLCIIAARGNRVSVFKTIFDVIMVVALFSAVHVFFAQRIVEQRMTIMGFSNFVAKSYGFGQGGGAIGALFAWPLYRYLGVAGGFIACLLIVLLCLTATGRMKRIVDWFSERAEERRNREEPRDRRRNIEQEFDNEAETRQPRRRTPARDPFSESVLGAGGAAVSTGRTRQRASQPARRGESMDSRPARPARRPESARLHAGRIRSSPKSRRRLQRSRSSARSFTSKTCPRRRRLKPLRPPARVDCPGPRSRIWALIPTISTIMTAWMLRAS